MTLNTDKSWWRGATLYQIYPRSFVDSNGDGVGDLGGIRRELSYVAGLGVDAVWISPFFKSPMRDFGYDVSDYCDVDPMFGSLADFRVLLAEAHGLGLRVLIDLVVSHTSEEHAWFKQSRQDRSNAKADWYVWANAKPDGQPPNNWLSLFGGSAWAWDAGRQQYYLHNFLACQPDLNFHHPEVQEAVLDQARFWLDLGVDGFRLDVVNFYFHDRLLRDNPVLPPGQLTNTVEASNPYGLQDHLYDKTQPENLLFLERFRQLLDAYPGAAAVGELGVDSEVARHSREYTEAGRRLHMVYSFDLLGCKGLAGSMSKTLRLALEAMEAGIGEGWVSWALSNHDFERVVSRWGYAGHAPQAAPVLMALLCSLRGSPCIYQGDELGLSQAEVPFERLQDPYGKAFWPEFKGRDGCRTPMPWLSEAPNAGFSRAAETWLPLDPTHQSVAVNLQQAQADSALRRVSHFLRWRKQQPALRLGSIRFFDCPEPLLLFLRSEGSQQLLCVFNLGLQKQTLDLAAIQAELGPLRPISGHGFDYELQGERLLLPAMGVAYLSPQQG